MISFLGVLSSLVLIFLGGIHFYWAVGGSWGIGAVLPTDENGNRKLNPKWFDSIIVGLALSFMSILYAIKSGILTATFLPNWLLKYGLFVVSVIFLLRAIGDFRYVGFFKKIKITAFAQNDTKYFSPLCLFLGVVGLLIAFLR